MFRNYLKIAWRSLKTNRLFSTINILGLSVGLATVLVLFLFIMNERSYDTMYANKDKIYRVLLHTTDEDKETWANAPSVIAPELKAKIPEVAKSGRILQHGFGETAFIKVNNEVYAEEKLFWCDAAIFEMFDINIIRGTGGENLNNPNTALLSESTAKLYFGDENPIGKSFTVDNRNTFEIKGVFKDFPDNSSLNFNVVTPFMMQNSAKHPTWDNASFETFLQFNDANIGVTKIEGVIQNIVDTNIKKEDQWYRFSLQPLEDIHLYSAGISESYMDGISDINQIQNLTALAILILIIACINYINLITARSQKRAMDVGVNKTLGASKSNLVKRFYIETGLITAIAMVLGIALVMITLPIFNNIAQKSLSISGLLTFEILGFLLLIWFVTTLISGSYPALYLSKFSPKDVLKPTKSAGDVTSFIRKGLVVVQFSASIILIISVILIHQQLKFMKDKNLGYNPENVIAISTAGMRGAEANSALVNAFQKLPNVTAVTRSQGFPGIGVSGRTISKPNSDQGVNIRTNRSEHHIADVLQLKLLQGKLLPKNKVATDSLVDVVVNKKTVDLLGYSPEEAIGKKVDMLGNNAYITGVVDDFNFESLHSPIGAYAFHNALTERKSFLLVRFQNEILTETMESFEAAFKSVATNSAFEYTFLDKNIERLYKKEQLTANIGLFFSLIAILVACLGLFALAAYMAEQRNKEIGIRKVFGASVLRIISLLSIDFMKLILISLCIGFPLALYFMNDWLRDFAYRINISWTVFLLAGVLALMVTFITVGYQAVKSAISNPVDALRTE